MACVEPLPPNPASAGRGTSSPPPPRIEAARRGVRVAKAAAALGAAGAFLLTASLARSAHPGGQGSGRADADPASAGALPTQATAESDFFGSASIGPSDGFGSGASAGTHAS
jgi:hypothetical protein